MLIIQLTTFLGVELRLRNRISIEMCFPRNVVRTAPMNVIHNTPFLMSSSTALKPIEKKFRSMTCRNESITKDSIIKTAIAVVIFSMAIRIL